MPKKPKDAPESPTAQELLRRIAAGQNQLQSRGAAEDKRIEALRERVHALEERLKALQEALEAKARQ